MLLQLYLSGKRKRSEEKFYSFDLLLLLRSLLLNQREMWNHKRE